MVKTHAIHRIVLICWALILMATSGQCRQKTKTEESSAAVEVRRPAVAGAFYPDNPERLADQVDGLLAEVPEQHLPGRLIALVSPHAGYVYSGGVAAHAYRQLEGKNYRTVILIGASHRASFPGASVYHRGGYKTPLGTIPVDEEMARKLMSLDENLSYVSQAHVAEHSLEVQLPFLQRVLEDFRIVPIVTGQHLSFGELESMAQAVAQVAGEEVLIVASTDMSHYPPYEQACHVDWETLTAIESFAPRRVAENESRWLKEGVPELHCTLCGLEPVLITMMASKILGANGVEVLKYGNSGDVPLGDRERVVGYCAVAFYQGEGEGPGKEMSLKELSEELDRQEQVALLKIARESIVRGLRGERYSPPDSPHPKLMEKNGAFVTLHKHGELRGCIGRFQPDDPLCQTVAQMAQAAAFSDHRFAPLASEELADVEIEISVLSPLRKISSIDEIQLGKHGIWITKGSRSGCFLPQVATETGWSKQEFLEHCCSGKALLPKDAYLDEDTDIYVFTAQVFHEN